MFYDLVDTTFEEHNEAVLNGVYPSAIVCFDEIHEVAIQKYKMLKEKYKTEGINQDLQIIVINGKDKYLPQIEQALSDNISLVNEEITDTGILSEETIARFFNKREKNLVIQTIQAINCTVYRDELWDNTKNRQKMDELAATLERVADVVPRKHIG